MSERNESTTIVVFSGIPACHARSMTVVADNLIRNWRLLGVDVVEKPLRIPHWLCRGLMRLPIQALMRYLVYPLYALLCWCRYGDGPVYYITDHANAGIALALPRSARVVVQVHDLASSMPISELPYRPTWKDRIAHGFALLLKIPGIHRADFVVTVSETVKQEICDRLKLDRHKVGVIRNGVDTKVFRPTGRTAARCRLRLSHIAPIILTVTKPIRRKNTPCLVSAFHKVTLERTDAQLVVVGKLDKQALNLVKRFGLQARVTVISNIDDATLALYYAAADAFVFPSVYEGFGLPPLEAMACGCPVIVSDIPVLQEVTGNAARAFPVNDPDALALEILGVIHDPVTSQRLRVQGPRRAHDLNWISTAMLALRTCRTLQETKDAASRPRPRAIVGHPLLAPDYKREPPLSKS